MQMILDACEAGPPDFATCCWMWDETSERLQLSVLPGTSQEQSKSSWDVCVMAIRFSWGWRSGRVLTYEPIIPPVPILSNAAKHIYNGVLAHTVVSGVQTFKTKLLELAKGFAYEGRSCDGHLANGKLHAALLSESKTRGAYGVEDITLCGNHTNQLTAINVVTALGKTIINTYYCCALFLKMGGHFLRLVAAARQCIQAELHVERRPEIVRDAIAAAGPVIAELKSYMLANFAHSHSEAQRDRVSKDIGPGHKAYEDFKADLDSFFAVFNGTPWVDVGALTHYCNGCCATNQVSGEKALLAIKRIVLRCQPTVPQISKWTKLGPCNDWFLIGCVAGLLRRLFRHGFAAIDWQREVEQAGGQDVDLGNHNEEFSWHAVAGSRRLQAFF